MSYKATCSYEFNHMAARDALADFVRSKKDSSIPALPEDNNSVQLIVLSGNQFILTWETRGDAKPAWLPKNSSDSDSKAA